MSRDFDLWAYQRDVTLDVSRPGKPPDDVFFNGRFRAHAATPLDSWFLSLRPPEK
ncbi:hypothetical protein ACVIWU_006599 [Bradyrhizobium sp. USDA 4509]